jgi:hypothetical protein
VGVRGYEAVSRVWFVPATARVELNSGRVLAPARVAVEEVQGLAGGDGVGVRVNEPRQRGAVPSQRVVTGVGFIL